MKKYDVFILIMCLVSLALLAIGVVLNSGGFILGGIILMLVSSFSGNFNT